MPTPTQLQKNLGAHARTKRNSCLHSSTLGRRALPAKSHQNSHYHRLALTHCGMWLSNRKARKKTYGQNGIYSLLGVPLAFSEDTLNLLAAGFLIEKLPKKTIQGKILKPIYIIMIINVTASSMSTEALYAPTLAVQKNSWMEKQSGTNVPFITNLRCKYKVFIYRKHTVLKRIHNSLSRPLQSYYEQPKIHICQSLFFFSPRF